MLYELVMTLAQLKRKRRMGRKDTCNGVHKTNPDPKEKKERKTYMIIVSIELVINIINCHKRKGHKLCGVL